ncbi:UDP-4-amino-4,6-dideoxy-N-acetyl-beta-L-altrosamine transaminase [soil metagenome]
MIPYGRQSISEADIQAVVGVLRSPFLTQGPAVPAFERTVAEYCRARHAVAVNSATSALHLACLAVGVGPGDEVWTTPVTFVATANCALYCGASVDFVDIDPLTYNLSVSRLAVRLEHADAHGRLPKLVIPVHLAGQSCEMAELHSLSRRYGFRIVEDASHAIGGRYRDEPIGSGRYSDVTVFSFHPVKLITTGEGGMAVTNDERMAERMRRWRSHGTTRDPSLMTGASDGPWYYQQLDLGFNYRMTDIQAALGSSQMERLDPFVAERREIAKRYDAALADLPVVIPRQHPDTLSARHLYIIRLKLDEIDRTHREVFERMRAGGVGVNVHYIPLHLQSFHRRHGAADAQYPEAEQYYREALSLPIYPGLSPADQDFVCKNLRDALGLPEG